MSSSASKSARKFLTARWQNLILANYAVPESLLRPLLPPGVELDIREGQCWASLVGFQFLETRVLGISWPGYRQFPEWNLRFYVRQAGERGVCFVREFVPQRLVAWIARTIYNEPYHFARMRMTISESSERLRAEYTVCYGGREHRLMALGTKPAVRPEESSVEHWFKEHRWGFGTTRRGKQHRYEVIHPTWEVYPVHSFEADIDWGVLYGNQWSLMNEVAPSSVVLAVGSAVSVSPSDTTTKSCTRTPPADADTR